MKRRNKIPTSVNVLGFNLPVEFISPARMEKLYGEERYATLEYHKRIYIRNDLTPQVQRECLLHELLHEIAVIANEELCREDADLFDEDWLGMFARMLFAVLRDNNFLA
ncbi:MAG: hypothetical protein PHW65_06760 [Dehalococcoidales bacterium]|nr:hypothetical protein [Dehalococcoidales bacterium]